MVAVALHNNNVKLLRLMAPPLLAAGSLQAAGVGHSRHGYRISDIVQARRIQDEPLKAQPPPSVLDTPKAAQIKVPVQVCRVAVSWLHHTPSLWMQHRGTHLGGQQPLGSHDRCKYIEALLACTPTHQLTLQYASNTKTGDDIQNLTLAGAKQHVRKEQRHVDAGYDVETRRATPHASLARTT